MYKKTLLGGKELYFVYAPPQTPLDPPNPRLPKLAHTQASREENSVYYYWWAFLRLNQSYIDCCNRSGRSPLRSLYADFGDVRGEDFVTWWKQHGAHCFAEPRQTEYIEVLSSLPGAHNPDHSALITVPLAADIEVTMKELRQALKPLFDRHREDFGHFSQARYKVTNKPVLSSLEQILRAKKAEIAHPSTVNHKLAEIADLTINASEEDGDDVVQIRSHRAHTLLGKADRLIANVIKGRFPDFSGPTKLKPAAKAPIDWATL